MTHTRLLVVPIVLALLLNGCAGVVVGGTATGASVANDPRTLGTMIDDETIELKAIDRIASDDELFKNSHINTTSYNYVVLLTGEVISEELRNRVVTMVKGFPKVRRVVDELTIAAPSSYTSRSSDTMITARVKIALLKNGGKDNFDATRVKVVTENGRVYLMGILPRAQTARIVEHVRTVGGVQRVVKVFEYTD